MGRARNGTGSTNGTAGGSARALDDDFAAAAAELSGEVHCFESLTDRLGRLDLDSDEQMEKAAELLGQAAQSHLRFVEQLRAMVAGIEDARQRQNRSAVSLSHLEEALKERRSVHQALRERLEELAAAAREVRTLLTEPSSDEAMATARARLGDLVAAARDLAGEARSAKLTDLERHGHAVYQQLEALSRKLSRLPS